MSSSGRAQGRRFRIACSGRLPAGTDDRDHELVVELRVVEAVEEVDRARPARRHADPDLAGELRVGAGGEGGDLLVGRLGELDLVSDLMKGAEQPFIPSPG